MGLRVYDAGAVIGVRLKGGAFGTGGVGMPYESSAVPATQSRRYRAFDQNGNAIGYVPIYV